MKTIKFSPCFGLRRILTKRLSNNLLVPVPTSNFSAVYWPYGAIGSNIYTIVEYVHGEFSTDRVFYLDCRSHTWHEAPIMWMIRSSPLIRVLDGKLYVLPQRNGFPSNSIEIFDPKTQLWEYVRSPIAEILGTRSSLISFAIDGGFYLYGDKCMVYKPKENKWDVVEYETGLVWASFRLSCVINNVIYSSKLSRVLKWYDSEGRLWRDLKGLDKLPKLPKSFSRLRLVNYGGKIAVSWEKSGGVSSREKMIWCAVIAVERRSGQEIYGKIEWCEVVLTVPKSCCLLEFFAVTV
ncbi:PREDICTED: putative F-box/kelch-repeat protein At4g11750 [Brassica oleracea var. oleracea]|uniref:putative F-box/kelch-repeat protein At4g11750 n=1 Tax=Brassica oleracea var. oleracea TaxID=109376 RepID=UPI0006A74281|nr:PREDICTED: putative F-box/kelch-repeat protein At4g11750 [Brassica oleracea var. oleracea]